MAKIVLTGATGFLGSHLLDCFVAQGHKVAVLKRSASETWRIDHLMHKIISYNIDQISLKTVFQEIEPDIVVHTACSYGRNNESLIEIVNSNLIFGLDLLGEAINNNVSTFINTDSLLPRNLNDYSLSKAQFTDWLQKRSDRIQVVNFKIEHMYGVNDDSKKFLPWLINEMINGNDEIYLTSGIQKRDFIYVSDVVSAYNLVLQRRKSLSYWNEFDIGTNVFTEVKDFVVKIAGELESSYNKEILSRLKFGALPYRSGDIMLPQLDNTKLRALGWQPSVVIADGVQKILKHYN